MSLSPGVVGQANSTPDQALQIYNALVPKEGPRMIPYNLDFTSVDPVLIDLTLVQQQQRMSVVQMMFVDNFANSAPCSVAVLGSQQIIRVPAGAQGYFPLMVPVTGAKFTVSPGSSPVAIYIAFLNVPVASDVWGSGGGGSTTVDANITGPLAPDTPFAQPSAPLTVSQAGGDAGWDSHSTVSTSGSFPIFPMTDHGSTYFRMVTAPMANDLWINRVGGAAGSGAGDCFVLPAGATYITQPGESCWQAWNGFTGVAGQTISALAQEGN